MTSSEYRDELSEVIRAPLCFTIKVFDEVDPKVLTRAMLAFKAIYPNTEITYDKTDLCLTLWDGDGRKVMQAALSDDWAEIPVYIHPDEPTSG